MARRSPSSSPRRSPPGCSQNLESNRRLALVASNVQDNRSVQLKGQVIEIRPAREDERPLMDQYRARFARMLEPLGVPRSFALRTPDLAGGGDPVPGGGAVPPDARSFRRPAVPGAAAQPGTGGTLIPLRSIASCFEGVIPAMMATCSLEGEPNITEISQVHLVDENARGALAPVLQQDPAQRPGEPARHHPGVRAGHLRPVPAAAAVRSLRERGAALRGDVRPAPGHRLAHRDAGHLQAPLRGRLRGAVGRAADGASSSRPIRVSIRRRPRPASWTRWPASCAASGPSPTG